MTQILYFRCPTCDQGLTAELEDEGVAGECSVCGTGMLVPGPPAENSSAPPIAEAVSLKFHHRGEGAETEMDMTPMVDVTFLLLIFFMVTATFTLQKSFEVPTPREDQASSQATSVEDLEEDPDVVTVRIDEYNTYFVSCSAWDQEQEAPSKQELVTRMREARDESSPSPTRMLILAHPECMHEKVVVALDTGNGFKMEDVKLVTMDEE